MMKKQILFLVVLVLVLSPLMARGAGGGDPVANWPTRPINLVVAFAAGGNSDNNARVLGRYLTHELGVPIIVTNVPAGGGTVAAAQVRDARPDGYTVLVHQLSMNIAYALGMMDFTFEDLAVVCVFAKTVDEILIVNRDAPWHSIPELIADSQRNPGTIRLGANTGAVSHWVAIEMQRAGGEFNVVSIGGSGERIPLLLGGHVDVLAMPISMIQDYLDTGQFRPLATTSPLRPPLMPDVPTLLELGVEVGYYFYNTFFMPPGTHPDIVARFSEAVRRVVHYNASYAYAMANLPFLQVPFWMDTQATIEHYRNELRELMAISHILRGN